MLFIKISNAQVVSISAVDLGKRITKLGTGVLIPNTNKVVTCYHVIENCTRMSIIISNKQYLYSKHEIVLERISPQHDLAIFSINGLDKDLKYFTGVSSNFPIDKQELNIIGMPYGSIIPKTITAKTTENCFTKSGSVRGKNNQRVFSNKKLDLIELDATILSGMSGAPIIIDSTIYGIIFASYIEGRSIGWAIPGKYINQLLDKTIGYEINKRIGFNVVEWPSFALVNESHTKSIATTSIEDINLVDSLSTSIYQALNSLEEMFKEGNDIYEYFVDIENQGLESTRFMSKIVDNNSYSKDSIMEAIAMSVQFATAVGEVNNKFAILNTKANKAQLDWFLFGNNLEKFKKRFSESDKQLAIKSIDNYNLELSTIKNSLDSSSLSTLSHDAKEKMLVATDGYKKWKLKYNSEEYRLGKSENPIDLINDMLEYLKDFESLFLVPAVNALQNYSYDMVNPSILLTKKSYERLIVYSNYYSLSY